MYNHGKITKEKIIIGLFKSLQKWQFVITVHNKERTNCS